jgi:hypothetical protein
LLILKVCIVFSGFGIIVYFDIAEEKHCDMKTALILLGIICFSFSAKEKGTVNGIWQGAYGMDNRIENTWVVFGSSNMVEFYEGQMKPENKMIGSYSLMGDTAISFTCKKNNGTQEIKMQGNLNRTKNFVDGSWESDDHNSGCFYLQKIK